MNERFTHSETQGSGLHIRPDAFPMPDRANTFVEPLSERDETALIQRRAFAGKQAEAAGMALERLSWLDSSPTAQDWASTYDSLTQWRSGLDAARLGTGIAQGRDRITTPITNASPNRDRIGDMGRLRAGAVWSDTAQAWVGGEPTPASRIVAEAGERALERFRLEYVEGDILQNWVCLSNGAGIPGNQLVRGETAKRVVIVQKEGVRQRGHDVSEFETGGDMLFMVTASEESRAAIFQDAMSQLELMSTQPELCTPEALANLAYLLFQSPQNKKGSDAVIRTFLVAAGKFLTGEEPLLKQDMDLRAGTMTQDDFVRFMTE